MKTTVYLLMLIILLIAQFLFSSDNSISILSNPLITFGLICLGAYISAFTARRTAVMVPRYYSVIIQGFVGGLLMGTGFVIGDLPQLPNTLIMVQGIFYWLSFLMPRGFLYLGGVLVGGGAAVLLQKAVYPRVRFAAIPDNLQKDMRKYGVYLYRFFGVAVVLTTALAVYVYQKPLLSLMGIFCALSSGFLLERNRFCMGLMMKEMYLTKSRATLLKMLVVLAALTGTWMLLDKGIPLASLKGYWLTGLGSFLMGFGFIIADGCYMGSLWKTGQGNLSSLVAILGIFLGTGISDAVGKSELTVMKTPWFINDANWSYMVVKIGLVLLFLVWMGAFFVETPQKVLKRGSRIIWLLSEIAILANIVLVYLCPKSVLPLSMQIIGAVLFYLGVALYIWARVHLGKYWGESIVLRVDHKLVVDGPYKYIRHPIYVAVVLGMIGIALLLQKPWTLVTTFLCVVPTLYFRAKGERNLLENIPPL